MQHLYRPLSQWPSGAQVGRELRSSLLILDNDQRDAHLLYFTIRLL